jgi:glutathione peroxidase-family protein
MNSWYEKYKDKGLTVIGLHTPEFSYEKKKQNVEDAMKQFGIEFPVVLDNNYETWNAYGNRFWPRRYLIDFEGNIVFDHIGEGKYKETEEKILELLAERKRILGVE